MMGFLSHWRIAAVPGLVLVTAAFLLLHALWIPAKAELAQWLMEKSWREVKAGASHAPPWPWADTQPVAVLEAPEHGIRQLVLAGDSGRNLAFGPAVHGGISTSDLVISGHRDTHFYFLQHVQAGDSFLLETADGKREYRVIATEIVNSDEQALVIDPGVERLSLVTCYPFDALDAGGPLRFVVTAVPSTLRRGIQAEGGPGPSKTRMHNDHAHLLSSK